MSYVLIKESLFRLLMGYIESVKGRNLPAFENRLFDERQNICKYLNISKGLISVPARTILLY